MINFNKMEEKDFVFINKIFKPEEEKAFSDFLMSRKKNVRSSEVVLRTRSVRKAVAC